MTAAQARILAYLAGVALGLFMAAYGTITNNPEAVTTGIGLVTVGGLAAGNVYPRSGGDHAAE